jgi:uncharacterized membrane protein YeaQ/YmgE (transglycosylase-associated protein family)
MRGPSLLAWTQVALVFVLIAAIGAIVFLLIRTGMRSGSLSKDERTWLDYGNLYVVALGIGAVTVGFLVILIFLDQFPDTSQALGFLTALFGAIVGLVGTYFGVKSSADAREGTEKVEHGTDRHDRAGDSPGGCRSAAGRGCQPHANRHRG